MAGTGGDGKSVAVLRAKYYKSYANNHDLFKDTLLQSLSQFDGYDHLFVRNSRWLLLYENFTPPTLNLSVCLYFAIRR
ncbi:hypothetical protein MKX01_013750, partial [Papaver californicum]